jgi:hypothetical protein
VDQTWGSGGCPRNRCLRRRGCFQCAGRAHCLSWHGHYTIKAQNTGRCACWMAGRFEKMLRDRRISSTEGRPVKVAAGQVYDLQSNISAHPRPNT